MGNYWMLVVYSPDDQSRATIGRQPDLSQLVSETFLSWYSGAPFKEELSVPIEVHLDPDSGDYITDFFPASIPLMSIRLLESLKKVGVTSIDEYEVLMFGKNGERIDERFKAVNITKRIQCADLMKSNCTLDNPDHPISIDFESLVIDEDKVAGELFFRLHEAPNGIVVHDTVKKALENYNLRGVHFIAPEDWCG